MDKISYIYISYESSTRSTRSTIANLGLALTHGDVGHGSPWPAPVLSAKKRRDSNRFLMILRGFYTVTTFKYMNWYFMLPPGPRGLARPPHI